MMLLCWDIAWSANLLANPGFEEGVAYWNQVYGLSGDVAGWHWTAAPNSSGFWNGAETVWGGGATVRSGSYCVRVFHYGPVYGYPEGWRTSTISQVVDAAPSADYTASAWVYTYLAPGQDPGSEFEAGVVVEELDGSGSVLATHRHVFTDAVNAWRLVSVSFRTTAATTRLRYILTQHWLLTESLNHINWDDCELLDSASSTRFVVGNVTSAGQAVAGATVSAGGVSTQTLADGTYRLELPATVTDAAIRATKPGFCAQRKYRLLETGETHVDFSLVARGDNLLANAGFDDDPYAGGWIEDPIGAGNCLRRGESCFIAAQTGLPAYYVSGEEAICFLLNGANPGGLWLRQSVAVRGNTQYTASLKTRISMASGAASLWGNTADDQVAGLLVKEYDSSGSLLRSHQLAASNELQSWETISYNFTTLPDTAEVRIGPYAWMIEDSTANWWWRRVSFDDIELRGPAGAWSLSGIVRSGGNPLPGASVVVEELDGQTLSCSTDDSGYYQATVAFGSQCAICVSKAGFHSQRTITTVTAPRIVNFDLRPAADNLVFNPGFDEPSGWLSGGWRTEGPAPVLPETTSGLWGPTYCQSLPEAVYIRGPAASGRIYQDVPVLPSTQYTASVRFLAATDRRYGSVWGYNPDQRAALFVQELDASGAPIGPEQVVYADVTPQNRDEWKRLQLPLTTSASTAYIRVGGYAYVVDNYDANLARAIFDDFELNGPAGPAPRIADLRMLPEGAPVRIVGKVVSAAFAGFFYAQEPDRCSGIRVEGSALPGDVVDVTGVLSSVGGERTVADACVIRRAAGPVPRPLYINPRSAYVGLSPVGLYVTLAGRATDCSADSFTIGQDEGYPLKVYGSAQAGAMVRVTGALGLEASGAAYVPVLRAGQVITIERPPGIVRPALRAAFVLDDALKQQANQDSRNYWWTYIAEVLDRLGLDAQQVQPSSLPAQLDDFSLVFIGPNESQLLAGYPGFAAALRTWIGSGGTLVGSGAEGLDALFGNEFAGYIEPPVDEFAISGEFTLRQGRFTSGVHSLLHPDAPLVTVGRVRKVRPLTSQIIAQMGSDAVITAKQIGAGWAFYFGFDLGQTFWTIQQGRPVDADYDGDGYLRTGDAMVLGNREYEVAYTDELLFLLQNMVSVQPIPMLHQLPPNGPTVPDAVIYYGGDDEAGSGIQLTATQFMSSRGLPYHINCMPSGGTFPLSAQEIAQIEAYGGELSLHYDFISGFPAGAGFTEADVEMQTALFRNHFGRLPVCTVNHWVRWVGWEEPAMWMMLAGVRGDNSRFCVPLVSTNPTNAIGFAFGTAFPYFFWTSYAHGNQRLQFVELPIIAYEVGYSGNVRDYARVDRALYLAQQYHLTMNFFYHPVYIAYYPACRDAIGYLLWSISQQGLNVLHTTPDTLTLWWMDRSDTTVSDVAFVGNRLTFTCSTASPLGVTVKVPIDDYGIAAASHPYTIKSMFGERWLMMVMPPGVSQVSVDFAAR